MPGEFEDLEVYQQARILRRRVWKLARLLPEEEKYILVPQMRRASLSVTNCIAEGHGSRSYRHNRSYLYRSRGSVNELIDDLSVCQDEEYFAAEHLDDLRQQAWKVIRLLNGYIRYLGTRINADKKDGPGTRARPKNGRTDEPTDQPVPGSTD